MDFAARTAELDALRRRRVELRDAMGRLERALAAPASGRAVVWGEQVHTTVARLAADVAEHIVVTQGPGGLHETILDGDLRLANGVDALAAEHGPMSDEVAELLRACEPPVTPGDVADVRERGTRLLAHLSSHRQRGADLVYEAFEVDLGGGD